MSNCAAKLSCITIIRRHDGMQCSWKEKHWHEDTDEPKRKIFFSTLKQYNFSTQLFSTNKLFQQQQNYKKHKRCLGWHWWATIQLLYTYAHRLRTFLEKYSVRNVLELLIVSCSSSLQFQHYKWHKLFAHVTNTSFSITDVKYPQSMKT